MTYVCLSMLGIMIKIDNVIEFLTSTAYLMLRDYVTVSLEVSESKYVIYELFSDFMDRNTL